MIRALRTAASGMIAVRQNGDYEVVATLHSLPIKDVLPTKIVSVEDRFQDVVMQLLAKNPEDRYQTPRELIKDLDRIGMFNSLDADK